MKNRTILVADDDPGVRDALRTLLETEGWNVITARDVDQIMECLATHHVDLVTLDLGLGGDDGFDQARTLRMKRNLPVVIISGEGDPFKRAEGLEAGADDYITKPFDQREVVIRLTRVFDRYEAVPRKPPSQIAFDHRTVDLARGEIRHLDGRKENLTSLESKLLEFFLSRPAQVLSRDDISRALYGRDWSPYDRSIDTHVARLRRKIASADEATKMIRSVRGVGYVLAVDVDD